MTYIHEYEVQNDTVKVEYCFSSVTDSIKVVDMWVNGKFHRVNWMSENGRNELMLRLMSDYDKVMLGQQDSDYDSEMDLDRDVPEFAYGV